MKKYLITGIIVWVPIAAIAFIIKFLIELINKFAHVIPEQYQPQSLFGFDIPGFSIIVLISILVLTGFLASNWLGKQIIGISEKVLAKIPLIRSIYKGVKQSLTVILSNNSSSFREVVMLEYPRKGIWSIGFKTSKMDKKSQRTGKDLIMIFIPTTPNPTSGFLVLVEPEQVKKLDMKVDEALKMIISLGTAQVSEEELVN